MDNKLTPREIEFLSCVAMGFNNKEIAKRYIVSSHTVKKTLENIFYKIRAKGRTHAVVLAILNKLITIDELLEMSNLLSKK